MNILIVEDNRLTANILKVELHDFGYQRIISVHTPSDARDAFTASVPDIVLMDINLDNEVDGVQLSHEFKEKRDFLLIFITGELSPVIIERAKKTSPANYLLKPINFRELAINLDLAFQNFAQQKTPSINEPLTRLRSDQIFQKDNCVFFKQLGKFRKISLEDILWVQADNVYIHIHMKDKGKFTLSISLKKFLLQVQYSSLVRVNRSQVINISHIDSFDMGSVSIADNTMRITAGLRDDFITKMTS